MEKATTAKAIRRGRSLPNSTAFVSGRGASGRGRSTTRTRAPASGSAHSTLANDAARAYDVAARRLRGSKAMVNFPAAAGRAPDSSRHLVPLPELLPDLTHVPMFSIPGALPFPRSPSSSFFIVSGSYHCWPSSPRRGRFIVSVRALAWRFALPFNHRRPHEELAGQVRRQSTVDLKAMNLEVLRAGGRSAGGGRLAHDRAAAANGGRGERGRRRKGNPRRHGARECERAWDVVPLSGDVLLPSRWPTRFSAARRAQPGNNCRSLGLNDDYKGHSVGNWIRLETSLLLGFWNKRLAGLLYDDII